MRTLDAKFLNTIANDPAVRPFLGRSGELDLTPIVSNPENFCFVCEQGGFVGIKLQPGIYELHTLFHPGDGQHVMAFAAVCMRFMFCNTDCTELKTKVPASNPGARVLAIRAGMSRLFERHQAWEGPDGTKMDVEYFSITIDKWALFDKTCREYGASIHAGSDDGVHDAFLGAAFQMIRSNNAGKGIQFYNRWAAFAEVPPINIIGASPLVFEVFGEMFALNGNTVEAMTCR